MATNEIYRDAFSLPIDFGTTDPSISSGDFVIVGDLRGVAETDAVERANGSYWATVRFIGGFTGTTADAVDFGDALYLAAGATNGTAVTTDDNTGSNILVGHAVSAKGIGAGNVVVRINN